MTTFRYKAISNDGAEVTGVIEAYDELEAVEHIKQSCKIVTKISKVRGKRQTIDLNEPLWVSEKSLAMASSQFAILLRAGLPMVRTVQLIADQTADRLLKKILVQVADDVAAGHGLSRSLEMHGAKLPVTFIETVRAGEESGTLETSFEKLQTYYNKSSKIKSKVRAAMMYPILLCVLAVVVIGVIMVVLVPVMTSMYDNMGTELPLPTRMLMGTSYFMQHWWPVLLIAIVAIVFGIHSYGNTENGKLKLAQFKLRLPVLGNINTLKAASQFSNTLATLLASGLPMTRCLTITGRVMDNFAAGQSVAKSVIEVEQGKRAGDALMNNPYLPGLVLEMTAVGEESGSLEQTLTTIGQYYDSEVEIQSNKALSMLEPIITVIMGAVVGFIVIAIYLPMFNMYGGIS